MCLIGKNSKTKEEIKIDIPILVKTRLLIQSNSGGGKSYLLRKILEETHGKIQHIVLDMEGEFASLREKYEYILVGKDGDIDINLKIAEILPRKLLETKASAIIDLYELKHHERILFVKRFLDSMINAPRKLWTPCIVVIDEIHIFCPEKGKAESMNSVIDIATRGRKRGYACIGATQRLSKLNKDFAAEMINKLSGRTSLDIDMKRASDELGFVTKQQMLELRNLEPGEFFAFGPAISKTVTKIRVDKVKTTHPEAGSTSLEIPSPPTPEKIKKLLEKLGDLPKKAEDELRTIEEHKTKIRHLKFEINNLKRQKPDMDVKTQSELRKEIWAEFEKKSKAILSTHPKIEKASFIKQKKFLFKKIQIKVENVTRLLQELDELNASDFDITTQNSKNMQEQTISVSSVHEKPIMFNNPEICSNQTNGEYPKQLRSGAMKMLKAVARFSPNPITKFQMATLSGFSAKGGTFNTYLSELKRNGWISEENKRFVITEEGVKNVGDYSDLPTDSIEIVDMWASKFRAGAAKMLRAIAKAYPNSIQKEELGEETEFTISGGTFNTYLSELRRNNLIVIHGNEITASKELFLEN